jgi:hypothetical protein
MSPLAILSPDNILSADFPANRRLSFADDRTSYAGSA